MACKLHLLNEQLGDSVPTSQNFPTQKTSVRLICGLSGTMSDNEDRSHSQGISYLIFTIRIRYQQTLIVQKCHLA